MCVLLQWYAKIKKKNTIRVHMIYTKLTSALPVSEQTHNPPIV